MREYPFEDLRPTDELLRRLHHQYRISPADTRTLRHADVQRSLQTLEESSRSGEGKHPLKLREVGSSLEGRALRVASLGSGPRSVFLWSQMHSDESTHTGVLLDILNTFVGGEQWTIDGCALLELCTLHMLPMLNPDGAEKQTRKNAQGIDINRDAVDLATPEGRVLRSVVNELRPQYGFNLHNQRADKVVADSGKVAVLSILAPPIDQADSVTPGVVRARQLALEMFAVATRQMPGHASRYEAGYMPTAFGEWVQTRGASTSLLEAGGWPEDRDPAGLVELHYIALMTALLAIARDQLQEVDATRYETLPLNVNPKPKE